MLDIHRIYTPEELENEINIFSKKYFEFISRVYNPSYFNSLTIDELKHLASEAKEIQQEYKNLELIVKKDANSLYGTSASIYFSLVNFRVAGDITGTGKHYAIIADRAINNIFVYWGEKELKIIQEFYPNVTSLKKLQYVEYTKTDVCNYGDTDSRYIDLELIYDLLVTDNGVLGLPPNNEKGNKELSDFALFLADKFINKAIFDAIDADLTFRNGNKGYLKMTHEVTTRNCVFQAKKKYVLVSIWKDGKYLPTPKLKVLGVELKQGGINERLKKLIEKLVIKYLVEDYPEEELRKDIVNLIGFIKKRAEKSFIYRISAVSGLNEIRFEDGKYVSDKNHIQMKMALSWMNFIEENNLRGEYKKPFENQKMSFYYDTTGKVIAVPDDVDIDTVKGLPEPDWNLMLKDIFVKNILKYIREEKEISPKIVDNFLLGIKPIKI